MATPSLGEFGLYQADHVLGRAAKRTGQFENGGQARLLMSQFEDADIRAAKPSLEPKLFLGKARFKP